MRKSVILLPMLLALGACSSSEPQSGYVARADYATPETTPVAGADASLMLVQMPSPGGLVTKVRETTYPNGVTQQAILEGGGGALGENHLEVSVMTSPSNGASGMLNMGPPSQDGIRREIIGRYPKFEMRIVTQPRQNALGVFGLAIGRGAGGARCIFAWQWVEDIHNPGQSSSGSSFFSSRSSDGATPASIRVHLCRKDATVDDLAATVEGMTLASPAIVARALDPGRRVAPTVSARSGRDMTVAASSIPDGSLESALGPSKQPVVVAQAEPRRRRAHVARRRAPAREQEPTYVEAAPVAASPAYSSGPRYLAPVAGQSAGPAYAPPMQQSQPQTAGLDPSLPAAAYRGPSARNY
ncbi:MAG: cellulose biosynthesis protein BcsN [Hyphomicrobiales bacterium]|nr:cellulose biosynthesis protein BcsN [Hyphomicrobiales bacterium]